MKESLLEFLAAPSDQAPFSIVNVRNSEGDDVIEGELRAPDGKTYPITRGIPRFIEKDDHEQKQIIDSFDLKWSKKESYSSKRFGQWYLEWLIEKYGFQSPEDMKAVFSMRTRILEIGCGSGLSAAMTLSGANPQQAWIGVDITSAIDLAYERYGSLPNTHFVQADLMALPLRVEAFDTIFAEGVLHHTPSTEKALKTMVGYLERGGVLMFYVYRKKGPIREFSDDFIREVISSSDPEEAWEIIKPLTKLGRALAELEVEVDIPKDIPCLDIDSGKYDVQRFIYWNFAKMFWNPEFSFEENNHINYDWYRPQFAHRQTEDEVRTWCDDAGLSILHFHEQESGYTVRAVKE